MNRSTTIAAAAGGLLAAAGGIVATGSETADRMQQLWNARTGALADGSQGREGGLRVIEVHQTTCQFLEAEHYVDQGFVARSAEDCKRINEATWRDRVPNSRPLIAMQGEFLIRVTNVDVPYDVDFWLRPYENHFTERQPQIALPEYRIAAIPRGETREIRVTLPRSFYAWSSPANPTPDYSLLIYDPDPRFHW
jgi:hypothetical protein